MRIISQCKTVDIDYNKNDLEIIEPNSHGIDNLNKSIFYLIYPIVNPRLLGKYTSKEKALKVMKMIRDYYKEDDEGRLGATVNAGIGGVIKVNTYFYMPLDEDVK